MHFIFYLETLDTLTRVVIKISCEILAKNNRIMGMMSLLKKEISGISGKFNFYNADELALKINFKFIFCHII